MNDEHTDDATVPPKPFSLHDHPKIIEWSTPDYRPYMGENEPAAIANRRLVLE